MGFVGPKKELTITKAVAKAIVAINKNICGIISKEVEASRVEIRTDCKLQFVTLFCYSIKRKQDSAQILILKNKLARVSNLLFIYFASRQSLAPRFDVVAKYYLPYQQCDISQQ